MLTLNTQAFTQTRLKLSECWDKIKVVDKERKKERAHQKALHKQNLDAVLEKIKAFSAALAENQLSVHDAHKQLEDIQVFMRQVELGRDEIRLLKDELAKARQPLLDKTKAEEMERKQQEAEKEKQKLQKIRDLQSEIEQLFQEAERYTVEQICAQRDALLEKIQSLPIPKGEKNEFEKLLKPLRDVISDKKEKALLSMSEDVRESLQNLRLVLQERKARRQEIKNQLETFRKLSGGSNLDFEQAMSYKNQINAERERLEKINLSIKEIEDKIEELEG